MPCLDRDFTLMLFPSLKRSERIIMALLFSLFRVDSFTVGMVGLGL